jgi:hypothetical protein
MNWRRSSRRASCRSRALAIAGLAALPAIAQLPGALQAQPVVTSAPQIGVLPQVLDDSTDRFRLGELQSGARGAALVLRSPSSLSDPATIGAPTAALGVLLPQVLLVHNSAIPFSVNNGALWAGRGTNAQVVAGFRLETPVLRVIVAPEFVSSENREFHLPADALHPPPPLPEDRSPFGYPYYTGEFATDIPLRFGAERITRVHPGQSSITLQSYWAAGGVATENHWWGPGIRNALVLSNNAPGFPHGFVRTRRPVPTLLGNLEARWIVGGLRESQFFDTLTVNDVRSFSAFAITLQPRQSPNLVLGASRAVFGTAEGWGDVPAAAFDVFRGVSTAADTAAPGSGARNRDHVLSLFARWILPAHGFEAHAEWARTAGPRSLRDLVLVPNHTQGYTVGVQWYDPQPGRGALRIQAEVTTVEKSATFRDRPSSAFYISPAVAQGYTNEGQPLGAAIGPASSSQWLAADYVAPGWSVGAVANRIRWNEDIRAALPADVVACIHDVSLLYGPRASHRGPLGRFSLELLLGSRQNAFFQKTEICPEWAGTRNATASLRWSAPLP